MARQRSEISDENGLLHQDVYDLVVQASPVICVDVIPVDFREEPVFGVITRATHPEQGKLAILGGRIKKDETVSGAIGRHLLGSFGDDEFVFCTGNSENHPFYVAQYVHSEDGPAGYDPTKHAVALTYLIEIAEPEAVGDEARDFRWISRDQIPHQSAYNHHLALREAADFIGAILGNQA